jgi:RecB family exonuclease
VVNPQEPTRPQRRTLETLLLVGRPRPVFDPELADALRSRIENELRELPEQVYLTKARLTNAERCQGRFQAALANEGPPFEHSAKTASGLLVHRAVELEVGGREERDPHVLVTVAAERLVGEDAAFAVYWTEIDVIARDEHVMRATNQLVLFRETFPPLRPMRSRLAPMTEWHFRADLLGGDLVLDGRVDLSLGRQEGPAAGRLLIDIKGEGAWPEHVEDMRFYALVHTLRFGVPPYRVATVFLTSGQWQVEDVSERSLARAADRVVAAARTAAQLARGAAPALTPGRYCSWCPRSTSCPASAAAV